jgi:hypothetical protein
MRDHELELDGEPNDDGVFPVVEDYLADADRIRAGESPLHAHTLEVLADTTGPAALVDEPAAFLALVGRLEAPARPLLDTSNPLEASIARARDEDAEQDAAYERASADVVLPLSRDDAVAIADALETLADLDEGEHLDDDELRRLARLVRAYIPPAPVPAVDAVTLVAKALAELGVPVHLVRDDVLVDTAARALEAAGVGPGSVPEGRAFVADVLRDKRDELELVDPYTLGRWLVDELTAE